MRPHSQTNSSCFLNHTFTPPATNLLHPFLRHPLLSPQKKRRAGSIARPRPVPPVPHSPTGRPHFPPKTAPSTFPPAPPNPTHPPPTTAHIRPPTGPPPPMAHRHHTHRSPARAAPVLCLLAPRPGRDRRYPYVPAPPPPIPIPRFSFTFANCLTSLSKPDPIPRSASVPWTVKTKTVNTYPQMQRKERFATRENSSQISPSFLFNPPAAHVRVEKHYNHFSSHILSSSQNKPDPHLIRSLVNNIVDTSS